MALTADTTADLEALDTGVDEARGLITRMLELHDPARAGYVELDAESVRRLQDAALSLTELSRDAAFVTDINHVLELLVRLGQHEADRDTVRQAETLARLDRALQVLLVRSEDAITSTSPQAAVAAILDEADGLGQLPLRQVASLLGVTDKTLRTWREGTDVRASNRRRLTALAHLVRALRTSMTAQGVMIWADSTLQRFGGRTPRQILASGEDAEIDALVAHARGNRG